MKVTQNCICFNNPCTNLLVPPSATREYNPKVRELLNLLQFMTLACNVHWLGFLGRRNISAFLVLIFIRTQLETDQVHVENPV